MKKLTLVASAMLIGTASPAFAAGDETGGGVTEPAPTAMSYSEPAPAPEVSAEEMTLLEYFLQLFMDNDDS